MKPAAAAALLCVLAALAAPAAGAAPAGAPALALGVRFADDGLRADASWSPGAGDALAATLRDGLESRITFTFRCYERRRGLAGLFGDALLAERSVSRLAFFDVLDRRYVVEQEGTRTSCADEAALLDAFFKLRGVELLPAGPAPAAAALGGKPRYVAARVQYDPVRLSPPLTILTLFGVSARQTSPWVRGEVAPAAGAGSRP